ncbi:DUF3025 domain-containing protein [Moraxella oculi]|uniref:DUF3025 domain-containing protein n=1 Tax=Moraxella oculi TaxID=2940516 RepID=A0ABW8U8C9_9GAMM
MSDFLTQFGMIDAQVPWLMPYRHIHHAFKDSVLVDELSDWLNAYFNQQAITPMLHNTNQRLSFVSQDDLPHGTAYEMHIHQTRNIPTRNNLHDWFGACIWSVFPKSKSLLNHAHIREMAKDMNARGRNRVRDAITVFDENGVILVVSDDCIAQALKQFDWQNALIAPRHHWYDPKRSSADDKAQVFIFGHALLEQLVRPRKSLCSHALTVKVSATFFAKSEAEKLTALDNLLAQKLDDWLIDGATPKDLSPLPILGVPYFWEGQDASFYDDDFVFRKGRRA